MEQNQNLFDLQITPESSHYLSETAKWSRFLSIIGFIFCGLLIVVAIFAGSTLANTMSSMSGGSAAIGGSFFTILYILMALLYFMPCLYLYRFADKMRWALQQNDQQSLATAFSNLKSCFKFMGIMTIVILSFYLVAIVIALFSAAALG